MEKKFQLQNCFTGSYMDHLILFSGRNYGTRRYSVYYKIIRVSGNTARNIYLPDVTGLIINNSSYVIIVYNIHFMSGERFNEFCMGPREF